MPETRRENYLNDQPRCPPTTDPGLIPEARRETLSERSHELSSDNRQWINTRCTTGKYPYFVNYYPLRVFSTKIYSDSLLLSTATTESGVRLSCPGWHFNPISDYLSTFLHFQNAAYLVKNQYKPITSFKGERKSLTHDSLQTAS